MLSALSSAKDVDTAIENALSSLKLNGVLLIYDYFTGDYRQEKRLNRGEKPKTTEYGNLFQRQAEDTNALYFNQRFIEKLQTSYCVGETSVHEKEEVKRKTNERWTKVYMLAKLYKK